MDTIAARDKEPVYTTANIDRTFFLLDLHRLRSEGDTLENALVVYRPEADLKRVGPRARAGMHTIKFFMRMGIAC